MPTLTDIDLLSALQNPTAEVAPQAQSPEQAQLLNLIQNPTPQPNITAIAQGGVEEGPSFGRQLANAALGLIPLVGDILQERHANEFKEQQQRRQMQALAESAQQLGPEQQQTLANLVQQGRSKEAFQEFQNFAEGRVKEAETKHLNKEKLEKLRPILSKIVPGQEDAFIAVAEEIGIENALIQARANTHAAQAAARDAAREARANKREKAAADKFKQQEDILAKKEEDKRLKDLDKNTPIVVQQASFIQDELPNLVREGDSPSNIHLKLVNSLNKKFKGGVSKEYSKALKKQIETAYTAAGGSEGGILSNKVTPNVSQLTQNIVSGLADPNAVTNYKKARAAKPVAIKEALNVLNQQSKAPVAAKTIRVQAPSGAVRELPDTPANRATATRPGFKIIN
jgi:hypothetical protein